jgi:hypothetical protein
MNQIYINVIRLLAAVFIISISACADKADNEEHKEHSEKAQAAVDVKSIDKNEDGKVFMCPMFCTDLVSDEEGRCPECEMKLTEYSIADAEKHLKDKGHKIKEHTSHDHHDM